MIMCSYFRDAKKLGFDDNLCKWKKTSKCTQHSKLIIQYLSTLPLFRSFTSDLELDTYHKSSLHEAVLQELSAANIFLVLKTGEIVTPSLDRGTILPGVTRDSILELAKAYKDELQPILAKSIGVDASDVTVTVTERDVLVKDLSNAVEVFITGTAAEVVPVQSISTSGDEEESFSAKFPHGESEAGPVTSKLLDMLREVLAEKRSCDVTKGWLCDVYESPEEFRKAGSS
jgi:branched-chain amino acid aminotransferase